MNYFGYDFEDDFNDFIKKDKEALKQVFKDKIKISFMFKILEIIKNQTRGYDNLFKYYPSYLEFDSVSRLLSPENIEYDLCNHIVGVHTFNMILLDEYQRGQKQNDKKYIDELVKTVLEQVRIRECGSKLFRKQKIFGVDDFLYYPPVYNLHVLLVYLITKVNEININSKDTDFSKIKSKKVFKEKVFNIFIVHMLNKSKGIIGTIDYDSLNCGYPILRNVIEMYLTYLCLKYSSIDIEEYLEFNKYKITYDQEHKFSTEFEQKYNKNGNNVDKIAYLNYGWIDSIFEFEYLGIKKTYKFSDVIKLVNLLIEKNRGIKNYASNLEIYYRKCHYYSHANLFEFRYPITLITDLCKGLGEVLLGIAYELNIKENIDLLNGVDILRNTRITIDRLSKTKDELTNEKLEAYYKNR